MNGPEPEVHPSVMDAKRRKLLLRLAASTFAPLFVGCATPVADTWLGADGLLDEPGQLRNLSRRHYYNRNYCDVGRRHQ